MAAKTKPFRLVSYQMIKAACRIVAEEMSMTDETQLMFCVYQNSKDHSVYAVTCEGREDAPARQIKRDLLRLVGEYLVMNYSASVEEVTHRNGNNGYELFLNINYAAGAGFAGWPEPPMLDYDDPGYWS